MHMSKNLQEKSKTREEFDCNIYLLIRNNCKRCPKQKVCEESDLIEEDYQSRQDKKLSNSSIQKWQQDFYQKRVQRISKRD